MKRILLVFLCLVFCVLINAQDTRIKSKVELKSGKTEIVGFVTQQSDGGYLVETESGDVFYYSQDEIKNITTLINEEAKKQARQLKKEEQMLTLGKDRSKIKGLMCIVEGGFGYTAYSHIWEHSCDDYYNYIDSYLDGFNCSASFIAGYRFSPNLFMGIGIGIDDPLFYQADPLFIHLRSELTKRKIAPYLALSVGSAYLDYFPSNINDNTFIEATIGIRKHLKKHGSMWCGFSVGMFNYCSNGYDNDAYKYLLDESLMFRIKTSYSF
ncbi:MAG: hypothetical protein J6Q19_06925 [Bacteroidaceae bacterium]|nr:hypothetical protein [Bacteroidaceae bacterium]